MTQQRQLQLTDDSTEFTTVENQAASFPRLKVGNQVTDHSNRGGEVSPLRNHRSIFDEPTASGSWHVDLVCTNEAQQGSRYLSVRQADLGTGSRLPSELAPCAELDGCAELATDASASERWRNAAVVASSDDRVIRSLSCALEAAEEGDDHPCAEALRVAIAVRLMGLRSKTRTDAEPTQAKRRQARALQKWRLKRVVEYIDNHLSARITLSDLAAVAGLSRMHFASQFRMATNLRPHEFLLQQRIKRAEVLLQSTTMPIVEIALTVGFQTQAHFTTVFKRFVGETPQRWRGINQMPSVPQSRSGKRGEISVLA
jgi:AraC family transcriptional regulator